jgi:ankyrin repeat protein
MIELLLRYGANPNAPAFNDENAPTAFIFFLYEGCPHKTVKLFLENNADITKCWGTKSALEAAACGCGVDVVETVISLMVQLPGDLYSNALKRVLGSSIEPGDDNLDLELVKLLLNAGADPNAPDQSSRETLLQKSLANARIDIVSLLLEGGAEVNIPATNWTGTPLQEAILKQEVDTADLLLARGADINAPPARKNGATALQAAAIRGYYSLALRLLENGADVAAEPSPINGRTAIDGAAEAGHLEILQLLLNAYGFREDLPFVCSRAASLAERRGQLGVANWLRDYNPLDTL